VVAVSYSLLGAVTASFVSRFLDKVATLRVVARSVQVIVDAGLVDLRGPPEEVARLRLSEREAPPG
jgi:hypothetical protein